MEPKSRTLTKNLQLVLKVLGGTIVLVVLYWIIDFVWSITRLVGW
jgi:hypothetical protein